MRNTSALAYLFHFMTLFEVDRFELLREDGAVVSALVGFPDDGNCPYYDREEEVQEVAWSIQSFDNIDDVMKIVDFLRDHFLMVSDKINIDEDDLLRRCSSHFHWDRSRASDALSSLLEFRVDMVDEGEKTDYFFVHF